MSFAATWMDLETTILSEVSQIKTNIIWYHSYVESKKKKKWYQWTYIQNRNRCIDIKTNIWLPKQQVRGDKLGLGVNLYTLVHECSVMSNSLWPHGLQPTRLSCPWNFPAKNIGASCHFLLYRIFLTPGLNLSPAFGMQIFITAPPGKPIYILLYVKETTKKDIMYSTGNYIQYFVTTCKGKQSEKIYTCRYSISTYIYIYIYT